MFILCRWFHGSITREKAEELLKPFEEGLFLVRESHNYQGDYTLSVWYVICFIVRLLELIVTSSELSLEVFLDLTFLKRDLSLTAKSEKKKKL